MSKWDDSEVVGDVPMGGTGISVPVQRGMKVSAQDQAIRDKARLDLLEKEQTANPNDPALGQEVRIERRKQGTTTPVSSKWEDSEVVSQATPTTHERGHGEQLARQLGLTGRSALEGVASIPAALGNATDYVSEKLTGKKLGVGGNLGTTIANMVGLPIPENGVEKFSNDVVQTILPGGAAAKLTKIPELAGKGFWRTLGRNAAMGTTTGAAASAALGQDPTEGALTGAIAGPLMAGAGNAISKVVSPVVNWGLSATSGARGLAAEELQKTLGPRVQAAIDRLRNLKPTVQGEMPTAGRAANEHIPELKAWEEVARSKPGVNNFLERDASNEAARAFDLERIARQGRKGVATQGGPVPLSPNELRRSSRSTPLYEASKADRVTMTPEMEDLVAGAEVRPAVVRGRQGFSQEQTNAQVGGRPVPAGPVPAVPGTPAMAEVRDSSGIVTRPAVPEVPGTPGNRSIQDLQQVKNELSARIKRLSMSDPDEAHRLSIARDQLNREMAKQSPKFEEATNIFRQFSQPQNQSDIAQVLANALRKPGGTENPKGLLAALADEKQVMKQAGQLPHLDQIGQVMTPTQMRQINNIRNSAQREVDYKNLPTSPSMLPEFMSPMDKLEKATPGWFSRMLTLGRAQARRMGQRTDEQVYKVVNDALRDPNKMADLLSTVPPTERSALINALRRTSVNPAILPQMIGTTVAGKEQ